MPSVLNTKQGINAIDPACQFQRSIYKLKHCVPKWLSIQVNYLQIQTMCFLDCRSDRIQPHKQSLKIFFLKSNITNDGIAL